MNRQQLYHETVDILRGGYMNDTLRHQNCCACAVGNMVAARTGKKFVVNERMEEGHTHRMMWEGSTAYIFEESSYDLEKEPEWFNVVAANDCRMLTPEESYERECRLHAYDESGRVAIDQIRATGYTLAECAQIEYAFEHADYGKSKEDWMFNGLMAVIDVLDEIHEVNSEELTKTSKDKFILCKQ